MPAYIRGELRPRTGDKVTWQGKPAQWKCPVDGIGTAVIVQNGIKQYGSDVPMATISQKYSYDFATETWLRR